MDKTSWKFSAKKNLEDMLHWYIMDTDIDVFRGVYQIYLYLLIHGIPTSTVWILSNLEPNELFVLFALMKTFYVQTVGHKNINILNLQININARESLKPKINTEWTLP